MLSQSQLKLLAHKAGNPILLYSHSNLEDGVASNVLPRKKIGTGEVIARKSVPLSAMHGSKSSVGVGATWRGSRTVFRSLKSTEHEQNQILRF